MIHHPVTPYSEAWWTLRRGVPTASGMDALLTPEFKVRTGQTPETYLAEKVGEVFCGIDLQNAGWAAEQGSVNEDRVKGFLELEYDWKLKPGGFITDDRMKVGVSPDAIAGDNIGIEIKSPQPKAAVKYLLAGEVPPEYRVQVQAGLYITGWPEWYFVSYCRQLPPLIVRVLPDPKAQAAIGEALTVFLARMDEAIARIEAMQPKAKK